MVPGSFGCGSAVFAAMTTLAPSRAARNPIASPMPREAPVMNRVFPLSDIVDSLFAGEKRLERGTCFVGLQKLFEKLCFGVDPLHHFVAMAAHQLARCSQRSGRQRCDLLRCL